MRGDGVREPGAQPGQQLVAGQVAEGVVIGLEAVEVEEQQQRRDRGGALEGDVEVGAEPASRSTRIRRTRPSGPTQRIETRRSGAL